MRWFVEVSRVGENSSDEKYCVEAKQWQAALQEARKLRGDSGPLSKFSIELLDDGYRAVDPKQKLRFVVAKAPNDAALSTEGAAPHRNGSSASVAPAAASMAPPAAAPSVAPPATAAAAAAPAPAPAPAAVAPSVAPSAPVVIAPAPVAVVAAPVVIAPAPVAVVAAPVVIAPASVEVAPAPAAPAADFAAQGEPYAGVPSSALSPHAPSGVAPVVNKSPSAFPPRPEGGKAPSVRPSAGITVPNDVIPAAPAVPKGLGPAVASHQNLTQPSAAIDMPPPSSVLRKRQEEPTTESPITYREIAYVVEPGVSRGSVEALLWASFRDLSRELASRPGQKFVQLAVFDHKFDKRPERAPLGTLAWKDWRGNPVLTFPFFDGTAPARASMPAPSIKPIAVVQISSSAPPPAPEAAPAAFAPAPAVSAPVPAVSAPAPEAAPAAAVSAPAPAPVAVEAAPAPVAATPAPTPAVAVQTPPAEKSDPQAAIPLTREKMPSHPSNARASKPRLAAVRRRAGEDLIGELFETMHDLHFMQGVADGAEFMLASIESIVPCDGVLVQVFDINTRQFVVVRAKGPGTMQVLLHRTPDTDPFISAIMRRPGSVAIHDVQKDTRVLGPRWDALGVTPQRALCGPVRQGGRYLGLIEVANPLGDAPFHQTEQNAIDYVCEQFAQFLANRPIVLEADVILRR
jgi:hypothetical protein